MNAQEPSREWKQYFAQAMGFLRKAYPAERSSDDEWKATMRAWAHKLQRHPHQVVGQALSRAVDQYPDRFPTLGQVDAICTSVAKSFTPSGELLSRTPRTLPAIEARILDAQNPFEQLARLWEGEARHGRFGSNPPPADVLKRWMKDFWAVWEKAEAAKANYRHVKGEDGKWTKVPL